MKRPGLKCAVLIATLSACEVTFTRPAGIVIDGPLPADAKPIDAMPEPPKPCTEGSAQSTFGNHCYMRFDTAKNFTDARADCVAKGGYLVSITSQAEQDAVVALSGSNEIYIGAYDNGPTMFEWTWASMEAWSFTKWQAGEPNNRGNERCAIIVGNEGGGWDNRSCNDSERYICERP